MSLKCAWMYFFLSGHSLRPQCVLFIFVVVVVLYVVLEVSVSILVITVAIFVIMRGDVGVIAAVSISPVAARLHCPLCSLLTDS